MQLNIGGHLIDSFWIGSVLVIVLTGLYTALGGMRAVAYNDAVQVTVLIGGSALLTFYGLHQLGGWGELKRICGSDMFNLWKPLIPAGMEGTWAPVKEPTRIAWYFNDRYPWLGMAICARRAQRANRPPRLHLCRIPQIVPGLSVHHPRPDLLRARQERKEPWIA